MNNDKQTAPGFVGAFDAIFGHRLVHQSVKSTLISGYGYMISLTPRRTLHRNLIEWRDSVRGVFAFGRVGTTCGSVDSKNASL
jgi:hypothetical protein